MYFYKFIGFSGHSLFGSILSFVDSLVLASSLEKLCLFDLRWRLRYIFLFGLKRTTTMSLKENDQFGARWDLSWNKNLLIDACHDFTKFLSFKTCVTRSQCGKMNNNSVFRQINDLFRKTFAFTKFLLKTLEREFSTVSPKKNFVKSTL